MARVIVLAETFQQAWPLEALRIAIVSGCAMALIVAGRALPF